MSSSQPADQDVRERVIHALDTSFFLEAGAGAGKTRVMVDRILETVRQGKAELREIVAITFTEKAAGELRARVRHSIVQALGANPAPQERERLQQAQEQVDAAHIETIHAFASSLLRERPFEARIDPYFGVLDQLAQTLDFEEAWNEWLWSELDPAHSAALEELLGYGLNVSHVRDAAEQISRYRDLQLPISEPNIPDPAETLQRWIAAGWRIAEAYAEVEERPEALDRVSALIDGLNALQQDQAGDSDALARRMALFAADPGIKPPRKARRNADARERWDAAAEDRDEFADAVRRAALDRLLRALQDFVRWHADRRRRSGKLSFDDLLLYARDLIKHHPRARRHFRNRYRTLLIDEFQDTDPLQAELVLLLASEEDTDDWRSARPAPGKLFVVGDPKQSIYRFRRADIRIYQRVQQLFVQANAEHPDQAAVERLGVNFRSRPNLVDWANDAFPQVLSADPEYPEAQAEYGRPIAAHRGGAGPGVVVIPGDEQFERAPLAREAEAQLLARLIHALVDDQAGFGHLPCGRCDACEQREQCLAPRPPSMGDIAVLVRSRTDIERYTNIFDAHAIPYHLDSGRGFFARPEVRDLTNILMAVDDPTDEVAVMSALKTPVASASDQELFDYVYSRDDGKLARFTLDDNAVPAEYDGPLCDGFARLRELREGLRNRSLPQFVEFVLRKSRLLDAQFAHARHGDDRAANLLMLVHRAADFVEAADDSLRPFVQWLSQRREQDLSEAESATSEAVDQVVRILTIHQAKGLEFPIVIVPKLGDQGRDSTQIMVNRGSDAPDSFEIQVGPRAEGFRTVGFDPERESAHAEAEFRRLLYVASTRAEDWLILPHYLAATMRRPNFASFLEEPLHTASRDHVLELPPDRFDAFEPPTLEPTPVPHERIIAAWGKRRGTALAAGEINLTTAAPSQAGHDPEKSARELRAGADEADDDATPAERPDYIPPASTRDNAMQRGIAIHRALALADLADINASVDIARQVAAEHSLNSDDLAAEIERTLNSDLMLRAAQAAIRHVELPLVQARSGADDGAITITEGVADLAFRDAHGWVVVDFKSDRSRDTERTAGYQQQVRTYAEMLAATGERVSEAHLLFTHSGHAEPVRLNQASETPA